MKKNELIKMSDEEYFSLDAMNSSSLKWYKSGALHYEIMKQLNRDKKTKDMGFGDAGHKLLLEPEKFNEQYIIKPEGMKFNNSEGKEWKAQHGHKCILTANDWEKLEFYNAYWNLHHWSRMGTMNEYVIVAKVEGVLCKIKLDKVDPEIDFLLDIKTTKESNHEAFLKGNFIDYHYDVQVGLYTLVYEACTGRKAHDFKFFCLPKGENAEPFALSMEPYVERCQETVKNLLSIHRDNNIFENETCVVANMPDWWENKVFGQQIIGG